ncbi:Putative serine protease HhoB precursor [Planctomycetes bacterium Poly30]|uniref:Serine protease HhoB n=1 Tax=Saltatorellus ferox TaxID=2528018 RepID=A0A518EZZ0_9BACT|nr:Putative serine protease HhoB precursor [Planctomycetes bacterium Poly30]
MSPNQPIAPRAQSPVIQPVNEPGRSSSSGREALMVFFGTLGAAATALAIAVMVMPERFGLRTAEPSPARASLDASGDPALNPPVGGTDPSSTGTAEPRIHSDSEFDPIASIGAGFPAGSPPGSSPGRADGLTSQGQGQGASVASTGLGYLSPEPPSRADIPFAPRHSDGDLDRFAPRPVVERVPSEPTLAQRIFEDARASVAHVRTLNLRTERTEGPIDLRSVAGTGSGLVWDTRGHIVTSRHVVENVNGADVTLSDGSQWVARLIGVDDNTDIAVLQIAASPEQLVPIRVGSSSDLVVGMSVFSVACPYGLGHSLSTGSISGLNRSIQSTIARVLHGTIQTDAPIHPGSSGGALIDDQARVIGMNAAIHLDSERAPGVGFALPIDRLQEVVPALIMRGPGWYHEFGFTVAGAEDSRDFRETASKLIQESRLPNGSPLSLPGQPLPRDPSLPDSGLVIVDIDPASAAAEADLRGVSRLVHPSGGNAFLLRDIIVRAGGDPVTSATDIDRAIASLEPGEPLQLGVWRRGEEVSILVARPERPGSAKR